MAVRTQDARRERTRRRSTAGAVLAALLLAPACSGPRDTATGITAQEVRATLDRRAAAVMEHDTDAYLAALDPRAASFRAAQRTELHHLADVPLESWAYEVNDVTAEGADRVTAEVELRYRIEGYDRAPVSSSRTVELVRRGEDRTWYIAADRAADGAPAQLWQQGDVEVVRGTRSLVLGVGRTTAELRRIAATADRAVPAVTEAWPEPWAQRVVVLVPGSVEDMAGLLDSPAASYRDIAAVTTGKVGGSGRAPHGPDHRQPPGVRDARRLRATGRPHPRDHPCGDPGAHLRRHARLALRGLRRPDRLPRGEPHGRGARTGARRGGPPR